MRLTIAYDNTAWRSDLWYDWGFSCLVEVYGQRILFDTGANGYALLDNMSELGIDPTTIGEVVISHRHSDHIGGLSSLLRLTPAKVYAPASCRVPWGASEVVRVSDAFQLHENVWSTGALGGIEQSLVVAIDAGLVVIAGCAHPGVGAILEAASQFGRPLGIVGGLHGFDQFELLDGLAFVCPTHCTRHKATLKALYPEKYIEGGAGKIVEFVQELDITGSGTWPAMGGARAG